MPQSVTLEKVTTNFISHPPPPQEKTRFIKHHLEIVFQLQNSPYFSVSPYKIPQA